MNELRSPSNTSTMSCATNPSSCYFCVDDHVPWNIPQCGPVGNNPMGLAPGANLFTSQALCEASHQIGQFGNSRTCKPNATPPTRGASMSENKGRKMKKSQLRNIIRESIKELMNEQTNPFSGGGMGPNWQAAEAAWTAWNATNQGGAPQPDATFLSNMAGKTCGFYSNRLGAQLNSFVTQFGGSFGQTGSSNPAWQSNKYARIMWLANEVQHCNSQNQSSSSTAVTCINNWIDDSANDHHLTSAQCANGNQALSSGNIANTKFRHKSIADCTELQNKIDQFSALMLTTSGCSLIRKTAKHSYLSALHNSCC